MASPLAAAFSWPPGGHKSKARACEPSDLCWTAVTGIAGALARPSKPRRRRDEQSCLHNATELAQRVAASAAKYAQSKLAAAGCSSTCASRSEEYPSIATPPAVARAASLTAHMKHTVRDETESVLCLHTCMTAAHKLWRPYGLPADMRDPAGQGANASTVHGAWQAEHTFDCLRIIFPPPYASCSDCMLRRGGGLRKLWCRRNLRPLLFFCLAVCHACGCDQGCVWLGWHVWLWLIHLFIIVGVACTTPPLLIQLSRMLTHKTRMTHVGGGSGHGLGAGVMFAPAPPPHPPVQ